MKILMVYNLYYYGSKNLNSSYYFFTDTLLKMGHEVIVLDMNKLNNIERSVAVGKFLLFYINEYKPDILFTVPSKDEISIPYLWYIKKFTKTTTVAWNSDDDRRWNNYSKRYVNYYDYMVTTYKDSYEKAQNEGCQNVLLSQWAVNPENFYKIPNVEKIYDIAFIGAAYGNRPKYIKILKNEGYNVFVGGKDWDKYEKNTITEIEMAYMNLVYNQSRFVLVINEGLDDGMQIKARVFESPGSGSCVLMQKTKDIETYYSSEEVIYFSDINDLLNKLKLLYKDENRIDQVAQRGYQKTISCHTYESRLTEILNDISVSKNSFVDFGIIQSVLRIKLVIRIINKIIRFMNGN